MRILYVGQIFHGSTATHRMEALRQLGHTVVSVDTSLPRLRGWRKTRFRILNRMRRMPDLVGAQIRVEEAVRSGAIDVLWVDKGQTIGPRTLRLVRAVQPRALLVSYSPDDMLNPRNQSRSWLACVPLYDLHVTTKSYNVHELPGLGARRVLFVVNGYDPDTHRPLRLTPSERQEWGADVGFVGAFERQRFEQMLSLARAGIEVRIHGAQWDSLTAVHPGLRVRPGEVLGDDYARAICAARINLCFLRKANRDLQTTRTMEITACGGFMLAERTEEHRELFEEGVEAEFFDSDEELVRKARYYLAHEEERSRIAESGRLRCLRSGYSNRDQMSRVLDALHVR